MDRVAERDEAAVAGDAQRRVPAATHPVDAAIATPVAPASVTSAAKETVIPRMTVPPW